MTIRDEVVKSRLTERCKIIHDQIDGYVAEYAELLDVWKLLDTKAQVAIATAGIFLSGAFAFLRPSTQQIKWSDPEKFLLVFALGVLVTSILCGIRALELRIVNNPPRGNAFSRPFMDFYKTDEFLSGGLLLQKRLARFLKDQTRIWDAVINELNEAIDSKAFWTKSAQRLIATGAVLFAILSLFQIPR